MLLTKLFIPKLPEDTIHRKELFDLLDKAGTKKMVLVSAPAGYGKTTLISDWIARQDKVTVWCSLDKRDNDPIEFLKLIVFAIHRKNKEIGKNVLALLQSPGSTSIDYIMEMLINDLLELEKEMVLVLDDLHLIKDRQVYDVLTTFLNYKPTNLKLVISTRSDPPLSFSRLRSQDKIVELRARDLSFSKTDISFLFNRRLKIKLSESDLNILQQKTEGWIAGLQLTAITVEGQNDISGYLMKMAGDNRYIMDYLIEEVLSNQSEELREFLLKTSVLDQFNASLCNHILQVENSQQILEEFEKNNLFIIPLDFEKQWYRYHHLFADLLKHHLAYEYKNELNEIHLKASVWFEENNFIIESIEHAIKANNTDKAVEILNEHVENLWIKGEHTSISNFGEQLTNEQIITNPEFCIFYSWMLIKEGKTKKAEENLIAAEKLLLGQANKRTDFKDTIGKISLSFAYLYAVLGKKEKVVNYSEKAMQNLSDNNPLWNGWGFVAFGDAYSMNANLTESEKAYSLAVEYGRKAQNPYLEIIANFKLALCFGRHGRYKTAYKICKEQLERIHNKESKQSLFEYFLTGFYSLCGGILLEWNNCEDAKKYIEKGFELAKKTGDISFIVYSYVAMIHFWDSVGEVDKACSILNELEANPEFAQTTPSLSIHIIAWKAELYMFKNELDKAAEILINYEDKLDEEIEKKPEYILLRLAKLYILQRKPEKALEIIDKMLALAYECDKHFSKYYCYILQARAFTVLDQKVNAKQSLIKAIQIAQEEDYLRLFIEEGDSLLALLQEIGKDKKIKSSKDLNSISDVYISKLLQAFDKEKSSTMLQAVSDLTNRELETLELIAKDLTNQEIADKLFVSLNTIKTRLKNINLKLEVDNRRKAVTKAKELGIL